MMFNLLYRILEFETYNVLFRHIRHSWYYFFNKFNLEERKSIYKSLAHCLKEDKNNSDPSSKGSESKLTIKQMYFELARAEEIINPPKTIIGYTFKNKSAERIRSISVMSQYPRTRTPHADSLKPYIPQNEYYMLKSAEKISGMLGQALQYATITAEQDALIKSLNYRVMFRYFLYALFNVPTYIFAKEIIEFMSPMGVSNDSFTRFVLSICEFAEIITPYAILLFIMYYFFYRFYRNSMPSPLRSHFDSYPFFKSFKLRTSSITLINLAIKKSLSKGEIMSKIITSMAVDYEPYTRSHLNTLAQLTAQQSFSKGLGLSSMLPNQLKATIVRSNIILSSESEIILSSIDAVEKFIEIRVNIFESTKVLSSIIQFIFPSLITVQNLVAGGNMNI